MPLSMAPVAASFARLWPRAELCHLLDDALPRDLERAGRLTPPIRRRFLALSRYAADAGADGILFTCSAFGPAIEACREALPIPVLKPNEAMIDRALALGGRIALVATFAPTLGSVAGELRARAREQGVALELRTVLARGALPALERGDLDRHDALVARAARSVEGADAVCLAQFSMARAARPTARLVEAPVLTTPDSAVERLRSLVTGRRHAPAAARGRAARG